MMGVYIKGMKMPNSCYDCRFFVDAWCYAFGIDDWRNAYNKPPKGERLDNCPLIEVPTPHGRLIDAKALTKDLGNRWNVNDDQDFCNKEVWHGIEEAPTVIEAEDVDGDV